jgi:hypothetical protein
MAFRELNPEVLVSLWLKATGIWGGGITSTECLHGGWPCPFWIIPRHLPYNWGKARKASGEPSSHRTALCADLAVFWGRASAGLLHVSSSRLPGYYTQSSVGTSAFQVAELRGSLHRLTSRRNSQSGLWLWAKNEILKSSWICLLPTYQGALVAMRSHLDSETCSFGHGWGQRTSRLSTRNPS